MTITLARLDGGTTELSPEALQAFKTTFKGRVLTADDPEYEESRQVWNAMIAPIRKPSRLTTGTASAPRMASGACPKSAPTHLAYWSSPGRSACTAGGGFFVALKMHSTCVLW